MENYIRTKYLEKVRPYYNKQLIKVLTGQRRVGKTFLLRQIANEIKLLDIENNLIFIDKELYEFKHIRNDSDLMEYVKQKAKPSKNYLFIDEIQEITEFENALRSLLNEGNFDIYCTGSNSRIFSSELATSLSGRQIEIKVHSLSFLEFLQFHKTGASKESLNLFLKYGGLPYLMHLPKEDEIIFDYLKNILATILYRDVINRNKIRDISFFENLISYLADNTGSLVSANKISTFLKSQKIEKSVQIVLEYLNLLVESNIIHKVKRMDLQGKKIFEIGEKFYFEDLGLRNAINSYRTNDINKILENAVFNHLQYCGYKIHIGKLDQKEVDFVAMKGSECIYIQVAYLLPDEIVIEREFGNLDQIDDHFPKMVVSMDEFPVTTSYKGIKQINIFDFLITFN